LKRSIVKGASGAGVSHVVLRSGWRRQRLLILCYHGVSQRDEHECSGLYVSPEHLRRRFERLRELGCTVLSLEEGLRLLREGNLPPAAVALTFDDGFVDFHRLAQPLLKEFKYPATVYVATYYCGFQRPVFDPIISYLLWKAQGQTIDLGCIGISDGQVAVPAGESARGDVHHRILDFVKEKEFAAAEKDDIARTLADHCGVDYDAIVQERLYYLMNPEELADLDRTLIDVELHTHRHRPPLGRDKLGREINDNRKSLRAMLGDDLDPRHFCYPSGIYARQMLPWLAENDVSSATTCDPGLVDPNTEALLLPRFIDTEEIPDAVFDGWVSGFCSWLPQRQSDFGDVTASLKDSD